MIRAMIPPIIKYCFNDEFFGLISLILSEFIEPKSLINTSFLHSSVLSSILMK